MDYFSWSSRLDLGDPRIDSQHAGIAATLNDLRDCGNGGSDRAGCRGVLGTLADRMAAHFATEEELFSVSGYPDADAHSEEHRKLLGELHRLRDEFDQNAPLGERVMQYMRVWITAHVLVFDKAYAAFARMRKG